jgi:hypothetical protein
MIDRGFRNNNPGNIRLGQPWQGLSPTQTDPAFCQFVDPKWGIRAIAKIMMSYKEEGVQTIGQAITHWSPPSDSNPTDSYIQNVAKACSIDPNNVVDITALSILPNIIKAIIEQENGSQPYSDDTINEAISLAE